jgi:acetylornithine/N-succinyldiaminopimelate aminotransferase
MNNLFDAIMPITIRPETVFVSGQGSQLTDDQGNTYLDFVQGWAVNTLGHSHPALIKVIQNQVQTLINPSPGFYNAPMLQLANSLVDHSVFDHVFFTNK